MSEADRSKWDARYADATSHRDGKPSDLLVRHMHLAKPGPALDIACGVGRNARFLASRGFRVDALDISAVGLAHAREVAEAEGLEVNWQCQDLLADAQLPRQDYALIVMIHFVAFELLATLAEHLAPGGILIVEEHLQWPEPVSGPRSDRFRVEPGRLRSAVPHLEELVYTEGLVAESDGAPAALARLVARNPLSTPNRRAPR